MPLAHLFWFAFATNADAASMAYGDVSGIACSRYVAEWHTQAGKRLMSPISAYIYKKAGDAGANLGNVCNVAEYVALMCQDKGGTVGDAVNELLRREAKGIEPPERKADCN